MKTNRLEKGTQLHAAIEKAITNTAVYDNGGETIDRYTIVLLDRPMRQGRYGLMYNALACDHAPFHPQGFGQHVECENGPHLGREIALLDLPADALKFVLQHYE